MADPVRAATRPPANPYADLVEPPKEAETRNPYADLVEPPKSYDWSGALEAGKKSVAKTITEDVPKALKGSLEDPGAAAANVGTFGLDTLRALAGIVSPLSITHHAAKTLGPALGRPEAGKDYGDFLQKWMGINPDAPVDILKGLYDNYGGPEAIKRSIAERPIGTGFDLATLIAPAWQGTKTGVAALGRSKRAAEAATMMQDQLINRLSGAGLKKAQIEHLAPDQLDFLKKVGVDSGWNKDAILPAYRGTLFDELDMVPTKSMLSGLRAHTEIEDKMRNGSRGPLAVDAMRGADEGRVADLANAHGKLRATLSGASTPLMPAKIGEIIGERFRSAHQGAKNLVTGLYKKAFDPAELAAAGVPEFVPSNLVTGLPNAIARAFEETPTRPGVTFAESAAPNVVAAQKLIDKFSETGRMAAIPGDPMPPPGASGISWQSADMLRKQLNDLRREATDAARSNRGSKVDALGMRRILDELDNQFGASNPLLNDARSAHAERVKTFDPDRHQVAKGVDKLADNAQNSLNTGYTLFNDLMSGASMKSGEAVAKVEHLKKIFANDPAGMSAIKEGALHRILLDPETYKPLPPAKAATAMEKAISGPQADTYRALFSPEELKAISRHAEANRIVAKHTEWLNNSGTSYGMESERRKIIAQVKGGAAGAAVAGALHAAGVPVPPWVAEGIGGALGAASIPLFVDPAQAVRARSMLGPRQQYRLDPTKNFARGGFFRRGVS